MSPGAVVDLCRTLIRNACVNSGAPESGQEVRSADTLEAYLEGCALDVARFSPLPGRDSLVARVEGSDPDAPSLCLMGHTDVVPAGAGAWTVDPFAAEVRDGVVWGRGAVDMLNQTAAQAVAIRHLLESGFRPRGTLVFFAPADEEAGGTHGAGWVLEHEADAVRTDYVIGEGGGILLSQGAGGRAVAVLAGEKGPMWRRLHFGGTPGHGSMPYRRDNACVKAARAVTRLAGYAPEPEVTGLWRTMVEGMSLPDATKEALVDPLRLDDAIGVVAGEREAAHRVLHACTRTTFSPNMVHAGEKANTVAAAAAVDVDARSLPGASAADLDAELARALGDVFPEATVERILVDPASESPVATPLWDVLAEVTDALIGPASIVPWLAPFTTDARFFRRHGSVAYGFTLHDDAVDLEAFGTLFHGDDERVSVGSLELAVDAYEMVIRRFLG